MGLKGLWRPLVGEGVGTFILIFIGAGAAAVAAGAPGGVTGIALAHGFALTAVVYIFGGLSGAHVNPAVTLAVAIARKLEPSRAVAYWIAQFAGAVLAALALAAVLSPAVGLLGATRFQSSGGVGGYGISASKAVVIEALLTFVWCSAVLQAAVYGRAGNLAGLAIGVSYAACMLMGGPLTGASLSPARSLASELALVFGGGTGVLGPQWGNYWVYLLGPILGALLAGILHGYVLSGTESRTATR